MTSPLRHHALLTAADTEQTLIADADHRAHAWAEGIGTRSVFPGAEALAALARLAEPLSDEGRPASETLALLDEVAGPATVASNDPRYFGFVIGATLPVAAAAERLALAWDQCASSFDNSPAAHTVEKQAGRWVLDALDLPRDSAVGFTTSATAGTLTALATARRFLLARQGWDVDARGLNGAPAVRVVVSELAHITVLKALRVLGFGLDNLTRVPTDEHGRIRPDALPELDGNTLLVLQAGEVNTGEFDLFDEILPAARAVGAWVHVDGAFGLWARASRTHRHLAQGVEQADSWTTDAHKWLNTPYDSAMVIVREATLLAETMSADAAYSPSHVDAQKSLTLEFSRRPRGIPVWAALRTLGRDGTQELVDHSVDVAATVAEGMREAGYTLLNRVVLNQVLARLDTPEATIAAREYVQRSGQAWFGPAVWRGEPAFRISVSSWRTEHHHAEELVRLLREAAAQA
jgi:glutamate/tyrosine decarboxylase-like PLP-dependent enzyme